MDAVTLIVSALTAGAAAGGQAAVNDAYIALKELVQRKLAGKSKAEAMLVEFENDPETYEKPLKKMLIAEQIEQDTGIVSRAQELMQIVRPQQATQGKYNVQVTGTIHGYAQGDNQQVTMNFGNKPSEHN